MPFCRIKSSLLILPLFIILKNEVLIFKENDCDDVDIRVFRNSVTLESPESTQ